jgi:site-specific recombinase XerD
MSSIVESWVLSLRAEGRAPKTIELYSAAARSLELSCGKDLRDVTATDLRAWLVDRQAVWAPSTVSMNLRAVRVLYGWLLAEEEISRNPCARIKLPGVPETLPRMATVEEVDALVRSIPTTVRAGRRASDVRDLALILVLADSGVRRGELLSMTVGGVSLEAAEAVVDGKSDERVVPLSSRAVVALDRLLRARRDAAPEDWLWLSQRGGRLSTTGIKLMLERRCARAGIRTLNPHSFRHGMADKWLSAGGSEIGLQDVAGWKSPAMLRVYARGNRAARARTEHRKIIG